MIAPNEALAAPAQAVTLGQIETVAKSYDKACLELEDAIAALESDLESVKARHLRGLKRLAAQVANCEAEGISLIEAAPGLFLKPRTFTIHGVKCGFTTNEGKLVCKDTDRTIELIEDRDDLDTDALIRTKKELDKDALKALPAKDLARLGCAIEGAGDAPLFRRTAGDVEKLINKLIAKLVEAMVESEAA